jgi:hypothetical protein
MRYYAEGMALYYTKQFYLARPILDLAELSAKKYNNNSLRKKIMQILNNFPSDDSN